MTDWRLRFIHFGQLQAVEYGSYYRTIINSCFKIFFTDLAAQGPSWLRAGVEACGI